jgi:hypothetical protein
VIFLFIFMNNAYNIKFSFICFLSFSFCILGLSYASLIRISEGLLCEYIPSKDTDLSLLHSFQNRSGAHPASYPMGKESGAWSWPLISIYFRSQERWSYTFTPSYVFMAWCLIKQREKFVLMCQPQCLNSDYKHYLNKGQLPVLSAFFLILSHNHPSIHL